MSFLFFFFNDPATTEIYTLSLHDALPICLQSVACARGRSGRRRDDFPRRVRSEEHTSELQSRGHLVCRLLLEKKKKIEYSSAGYGNPPTGRYLRTILVQLFRSATGS